MKQTHSPNKLQLIPVMLFLVFFLAAVSASATTTYQHVGGNDQNFDLSSTAGRFNRQIAAVTVSSEIVLNARFAPLVEDLDNDGKLEIVVLNDDIIQIYNYSEEQGLSGITTYQLPTGDYAPL